MREKRNGALYLWVDMRTLCHARKSLDRSTILPLECLLIAIRATLILSADPFLNVPSLTGRKRLKEPFLLFSLCRCPFCRSNHDEGLMGECTQLSRVRLLVLHQGKLRDLVYWRFLEMEPLKQRTEKKAFRMLVRMLRSSERSALRLGARMARLGSQGSLRRINLLPLGSQASENELSERKRAKLWKGIIKGKPLEKLCQALMMIWLFELWRSATYEGG